MFNSVEYSISMKLSIPFFSALSRLHLAVASSSFQRQERQTQSHKIFVLTNMPCAHILSSMNTLTLALSNSAYKKALELARNHGVPVVAYLSTEVEDLLDNKALLSQNGQPTLANKPTPQPNFSSALPDTLAQVLKVCKYMYRNASVPEDEVNARAGYRESVRTRCTGTRHP